MENIETKAVEVQSPVYAQATRDRIKAAKVREQNTKIAKAEEHKEKVEKPKMADGAKKMYLDESLFVEAFEEEYNDFDNGNVVKKIIVEVYDKDLVTIGEEGVAPTSYFINSKAPIAISEAFEEYIHDNMEPLDEALNKEEVGEEEAKRYLREIRYSIGWTSVEEGDLDNLLDWGDYNCTIEDVMNVAHEMGFKFYNHPEHGRIAVHNTIDVSKISD